MLQCDFQRVLNRCLTGFRMIRGAGFMDIVGLCLELGVDNAVEASVDELVLQPEVRGLCEVNTCGRFGRNFTCPPYVGEIDALIEKVKSFDRVVIWQNIYELEDSFDFEGMMEGQTKHQSMTLDVARRVYTELGTESSLVLTAGGCFRCAKCASESGETCRNPDKALASLESYGVNLGETCKNIGMNYINGKDTVTYFSGAFLLKKGRWLSVLKGSRV